MFKIQAVVIIIIKLAPGFSGLLSVIIHAAMAKLHVVCKMNNWIRRVIRHALALEVDGPRLSRYAQYGAAPRFSAARGLNTRGDNERMNPAAKRFDAVKKTVATEA